MASPSLHRPRSQNRRNSLAGQPGRDEWQNSMPASHQDDRFDERPYTDQSRADTHESRQRRGIMKATKRRRQQYSDNSDDSGARPSQVRGANVRFTDDESMGNSYVTDSYSGGCMPPGPSGQPLRDIPHEEITAAMHNLGMSSEGYHQPSVRDRQQPGRLVTIVRLGVRDDQLKGA
ncbi:hypothetical protein BD324DRAFT_519827 [Kockovaella imperatae]|uniref:Uncharacterized protein n=1 Tax=Kockovaella imperatae TaxID=4999 RepID=A0A1Y1UG33_9TREE|nr:hypothetical protein BD324DRAFT_519827 [Kockovaella imperatae]ORX36035.1 hypothetical protein BD324DRAFT_519827 [Kockovaella imperatae]